MEGLHFVKEKIKAWIKTNILVLAYFLFAVLIETTAVFVVEGTFFIRRPFLALGLLAAICGGLLLVKSNRARTITCGVLLILQAVLDLVFSVIYDMTDQYFDFGMFNLRNDAFAILESIPVNFFTFYAGLFFSVIFFVFGLRFAYYHPLAGESKKSAFFYVGFVLAGIAALGISFFTYFPREAKSKYDEMIFGKDTTAYSSYGMIGNLLGEFGKAVFQETPSLNEEDIEKFIYAQAAEPSPYFGVCKDKNVVTVLAESLEWYVFLRGKGSLEGEFPNALAVSEEDLAFLYPNLTEYYNEGVVMTNFHSREKTDIAETLSILGSYPTGAYVNYEYAENTIPNTLPNILKAEAQAKGQSLAVNSFHNGFKSFYNREQAHKAFGFERLTDMDDMEKMAAEALREGLTETLTFYDYMDEGERNLDSEMIETAKDQMFPADQRFYTYITTITMHGMYYDRANMQEETNQKLAEQIALLKTYEPKAGDAVANLENAKNLYYYMTTGLELDYALGCIKADLAAKGLWEDTVILLFGDHNAYYQEISNYAKGITGQEDEDSKFTDLYNVPLMIRNADLTAAVAERGGARIIDKFTCTADIVPTLLDLLGIRYYDNLYYGNSVFSGTQSVLYSRAYDVFLGDGILRRSVKGESYRFAGHTETGALVADTVDAFEREGERLVRKIEHCDYIFRQNHFGRVENYNRFQEKMKELNGWA